MSTEVQTQESADNNSIKSETIEEKEQKLNVKLNVDEKINICENYVKETKSSSSKKISTSTEVPVKLLPKSPTKKSISPKKNRRHSSSKKESQAIMTKKTAQLSKTYSEKSSRNKTPDKVV